ncbi:hypothetical protein HDV02_001854 [Globomyces sp. JEL0801]|nr:hypothetical protein HDV02_001854 [Globomyces sp. JEL0801]
MKIATIGGGVIGTSLAYYLLKESKSLSNISIVLIEASEIAGGASGNAGGFLARNWHNGPALKLAQLSFDEHIELASKFGDSYSFQFVKTMSVGFGNQKSQTVRLDTNFLNSECIERHSIIGQQEDCALIKPYQFTQKMFNLASQFEGFSFLKAKVVKISQRELTLESMEVLEFDKIVCTAGPWTPTLLKEIDISSEKVHSIIVKVSKDLPLDPVAIFGEISISRKEVEIYPRMDEIYVCGDVGFVDKSSLPETSNQISINNDIIQELKGFVDSVSTVTKGLAITKSQACYVPFADHPILSKVTDCLHVASGHGVWGILLAPGTAKLMTELLLYGECKSLDLTPFSHFK